jgi:hypothetical protein
LALPVRHFLQARTMLRRLSRCLCARSRRQWPAPAAAGSGRAPRRKRRRASTRPATPSCTTASLRRNAENDATQLDFSGHVDGSPVRRHNGALQLDDGARSARDEKRASVEEQIRVGAADPAAADLPRGAGAHAKRLHGRSHSKLYFRAVRRATPDAYVNAVSVHFRWCRVRAS